jgi:hypothetical protein
MTGPHPPRLAEKLLSGVTLAGDRDALMGDLCEEYVSRASASPSAAARWYWTQAIRSWPILLGRRASHGRWLSTLAIAIAAYVVVGALNAAGTSMVSWWLGSSVPLGQIPSAAIGLVAIGSGAYLASRLRPSAGEVVGGLVAAMAVLMLLFPMDASPMWYQLLFLVVGPLAAHLASTAAAPTPGQRS